MVLPFQHGIEIVGLIGSVLGADKPHLHIAVNDLFKGLAVLFIDCQHEKREHDKHHAQRGRTGTDIAFQQEEQRDADQPAGAEAGNSSVINTKEGKELTDGIHRMWQSITGNKGK